MPTRISPKVDFQILVMLSEGMTNKQIAEELNVSASYVSKVKNGKKSSYISMAGPTMYKQEMIEDYSNMSDEDIIKYLDEQIGFATMQIQVYRIIIRRLKQNAKS